MKLSYEQKEVVMQALFDKYKSPVGFRSIYKAVPIENYEVIKQFIDFTKYFVMFRGPRQHRLSNCTHKCDAHSFDVYRRDPQQVRRIRIEREAFWRGVEYGQSYDRMITTI